MKNTLSTLVFRCPDRKGIIASVAAFISDAGATIDDSSQFIDPLKRQLCSRLAFRGVEVPCLPLAQLREAFAPIADLHGMKWQLFDAAPVRTIVMVSHFGHCMFDLVHRWREGLLPIEIDAVVSNHETHRSFVEWAGLPFHYLPITPEREKSSEAKLEALIAEHRTELVVLARYMRILSPRLCSLLDDRCINIHHGFLPSFKGAKPYHQAHARGVKVVGATAHFVTTDLDEGPIIEQDTIRVDHSLGPDELVSAGRDVESTVLRRAVQWYAQRRVMRDGLRTIVFR